MAALALFSASLWLHRASLPYNEEGRFFDAADSVVYTDSAVTAYVLLTLLFAALACAAIVSVVRRSGK
jgi:hypothetical protein